jgi:hypothetical protein
MNFFDVFFKQFPGYHDLMPAASALDPEVRPDPQHLPLEAPAGMLFFQF